MDSTEAACTIQKMMPMGLMLPLYSGPAQTRACLQVPA
jgi:hypothetical protein